MVPVRLVFIHSGYPAAATVLTTAGTSLFAVKLNDQLFIDRQIDIRTSRHSDHFTGEILSVALQPCHKSLATGKVL